MSPRDVQALLGELADWTARAGRTPETHRYGPGPEQAADLLLPPGDGPHPVVVLLHGGFWRARFTRALMTALAVDLAGRGWASWNVEYRRAGNGGGIPETLDDVRAAIDALAGLEAPLQRTRVVAVGHSAGGQLALCVAGAPAISGVVSLAGVCDLETAARERIGEDATREFMGGLPAEQPAAYRMADPLALVPADARVLLVHGGADDRVPPEQSRRYARAAWAAGGDCELLELARVDHFAPIDPRTPAWGAVAERLDAMAS